MLKLTKRTEYALTALSHMQSQGEGELTTAREISEKYSISFQLLSKILQHLSKENLIKPIQGAKGGYKLITDLTEISLWQFLEMMEGPLGLVDCIITSECQKMDGCVILSPIHKINKTVQNIFMNIPISDITN
ncbi:MAG: Rrf2 family transcriptional regulator [Candidatus Marinimicrobia bacterium]|nr:Rrf2 family transcriptional regulator [Candidatus Neomarinimicrobiota bacterium]MBL7022817.1 Rrf2 family transcriptional regulator [Candidatus Neomarinimicrobiota bacterium]MBL7109462.1 Rrf2 family transcriptional regulator [Candidatus Neomarinimicrobiota bacterium]